MPAFGWIDRARVAAGAVAAAVAGYPYFAVGYRVPAPCGLEVGTLARGETGFAVCPWGGSLQQTVGNFLAWVGHFAAAAWVDYRNDSGWMPAGAGGAVPVPFFAAYADWSALAGRIAAYKQGCFAPRLVLIENAAALCLCFVVGLHALCCFAAWKGFVPGFVYELGQTACLLGLAVLLHLQEPAGAALRQNGSIEIGGWCCLPAVYFASRTR